MVTNDDGMGCAVLRAEGDMELWSVREVASPSASPLPSRAEPPEESGVGSERHLPWTSCIALFTEKERERKAKGIQVLFLSTVKRRVAEKCRTITTCRYCLTLI